METTCNPPLLNTTVPSAAHRTASLSVRPAGAARVVFRNGAEQVPDDLGMGH
jgi:hypothetical protein